MKSIKVNQWENQEKRTFDGVGKYGLPEIKGTETTVESLVRFCDRKQAQNPDECGIHFFYDDYKFSTCWKLPDRYTEELKQYKAVISPDFSVYVDFPVALQIYSTFKNRWLAAYWQSKGVNIIPNVQWGDEESFDWCFDGLPKNSVVCVSSVGVARNPQWKNKDSLWRKGYSEMMKRLEPKTVIIYGNILEGSTGNIIRIPSFYEVRRRHIGKGNK